MPSANLWQYCGNGLCHPAIFLQSPDNALDLDDRRQFHNEAFLPWALVVVDSNCRGDTTQASLPATAADAAAAVPVMPVPVPVPTS
eukprot:CAMPEP_0206538440 /NCGR_PEP_ID=MMETSP0325_2-20121206/7863_1 /ASSEMBLY_ACC=CAM_ASM_000347 /TAXON_ID=2866 /ORGANISM="Crypthecodinium cohnii, Strain Seligo" /LENGTH=85 /DNA_ID=CAMNT_0054035877 /DNA_START=117 /DNA_END=371 /DNA_ORIENTATION=+